VKTFLVKALLVCLFLSTPLLFTAKRHRRESGRATMESGGMCRSN
jgi:hypothetical protein